MNNQIPDYQRAVQLIGPDQLELNTNKAIDRPGPYQILCRIEAVGLCFSDLKLLKQFNSHARKTPVISGIEQEILDEIPSYVPGDAATVPGHEAVVRVCVIGDKVTDVKVGGRFLVQTDYRWLPTDKSNAAFGYNFEGGLQQYVLMDQRVITSPDGESMLIPASDELSASAIALVEPWACVEDAYAVQERSEIKAGGQMFVVADVDFNIEKFIAFLERFGRPGQITLSAKQPLDNLADIPVVKADDISQLEDAGFDDVIYFGSDAEVAESLFARVGPRGLLNIVLCGGRFGRDVVTQVGRVHYGGIRIIGTTGSDPADSMKYIPAGGEIRKGDNINVIGAGGPMGVMHVVRNICQGIEGVTVFAGDLDDERLAALSRIAKPLAEKNAVGYKPYNPKKQDVDEFFDYIALMAPVPGLVAGSVKTAAKGAIINIFAGIPATVSGKIDLDAYIEKQLYFIGTSGSTLADMKVVLEKVETGSLDTNISVAAVCGLGEAVEGIRAVEKQLIPGKIVVYPFLEDLSLVTLDKLHDNTPEVAQALSDGLWNAKAEKLLLKTLT